MKIKKITFDIFLNIIAAALPIAMLQLVIYPLVAKNIGGKEYGLMLTIYSIWIMIPFSLGNVLNNVKLLKFSKYQEYNVKGDSILLLRQWTIFSSVVVFVLIWAYCGHFSFLHAVIGTIISVLFLLKAYLEVGFRIELNYIAILISNALLSLGFLAGYLIFRFSGIWEFIFLLGYIFPCVYCGFKTHLLSEEPRKTILYSEVKKDACSLAFSVVIKNLTHYADKLVLYPLMGGMAVSIYYTATILGKITGMLTGPFNSVMLSYIARWDNKKANVFAKVFIIGSVICIFGYIVAILLARPIIGLLFPQWLDAVMAIFPLTTLAIMLGILSTILNPFVLKYCKIQWQIGINLASSVIYFGSALFLWYYKGLEGFCIGTVIGALTRLIILISVYYKSVKSTE